MRFHDMPAVEGVVEDETLSASATRRGRARLLGALALLLALLTAHTAPCREDDRANARYDKSLLQRDLEAVLSAAKRYEALTLHALPGGKAAGFDEGLRIGLESTLLKIRQRLSLPAPPNLDVFLYDSPAQMAGLTGRSDLSPPAGAITAVHMLADGVEPLGPVLRVFEAPWARTSGRVVALEGGRWYRLRVSVTRDTAEVLLDGVSAGTARISEGEGRLGFGVSGGRLSLKDLKVRESSEVAWAFPLRDEEGFEPEGRALWTLTDGVLEGASAGAITYALFKAPLLSKLELEASLRVAAGASAEIVLRDGERGRTRLILSPEGFAYLRAGTEDARGAAIRLAGPHPLLRAAMTEAMTTDALETHSRARALLEADRLPELKRVLAGFEGHGSSREVAMRGTERTYAVIGLASLLHFVLEEDGAKRLGQLYFSPLIAGGSAGIATPLGPFGELEERWRKSLLKLPISDVAKRKARRLLGLDVLMGTWMGVDPRSKETVKFGKVGRWKHSGTVLHWRGPLPSEPGQAIPPGYVRPNTRIGSRLAVRAEVVFDASSGVLLSIIGRGKKRSSAMIGPRWVGFIDPEKAHVATAVRAAPANMPLDVMVLFDEGAGRLYVDGLLVSEVEGGLAQGPGVFALQATGEEVVVRSLAYRKLN